MSTPDQRDPMTPIATVRVVLAEQSDPSVITVLLDLLGAAAGSRESRARSNRRPGRRPGGT